MSQDIASLVLRVDSLEARLAAKDLDRLHASGSKAEGMFKGLGTTLKSLGVGIVVGKILGDVIRNTIEAEQATAQLEARLRSTGGVSGMTMGALTGLASSLMSVTTFSDEAIMASEALMLTFTKIGKEVFPQAQEAALNMSIALGQDLQSATMQLGKALNDPIKGLTALSRAGVQFTNDQKKVIEALVESGRVADAQKIILGELEVQMGGAARAARNTLGGALQNLRNQFGELMEGKQGGQGVKGATKSINDFADSLSSPEMLSSIQTLIQALFGLLGVLAKVASGFDYTQKRITADLELMKTKWLAIHEIAANVRTLGKQPGTIGDAVNSWKSASAKYNKIVSDLDLANSGTGLTRADTANSNYELPSWAGGRQRGQELIRQKQEDFRMPGAFQPQVDYSDLDFSEDKPKKGGGGASDGAKEAADRRAREYEALRDSLRTEEEAIDASYAERTSIISSYAKIGEAERAEMSARSTALYDKEREALRASKGRELEDLRLSLRTETETIEETYANRMALLAKNTEEGSALRKDLEARLGVERAESLVNYEQSIAAKIASLSYGLLTEEEMVRASMQQQEDDILRATYISEEKRTQLLDALQKKRHEIELANEREKNMAIVSIAGDMFGSLAGLAGSFAKGQGKEAKKAFEMWKALSIAQTIMKTWEGAQNAYASGSKISHWVGVMQAAAAVVSGLANVMRIRATQFSGGYDLGGQIPAGKYGIVGERGPEYVRGPAMVTSRQETARQISRDNNSKAITLNSTFNINGDSTAQETTGDKENVAREFKQLVDARFRDLINQEQRAGGSLWRMMR